MTSFLRVGLQTAFSAVDPLDPFRYAVDHGFDAFEWFADKRDGVGWDFADLDAPARSRVREQGAELGMMYSVHAPWECTPVTAEGRRQILESIAFARDIGAELVNFHLTLDDGVDAFAQGVIEMAHHAAEAGVRLTLENTPETTPPDCNRALAAIRQRGAQSDRVGLCLDVGHANLCTITRNDYIRFIDGLDPELRITHVHLHENYGDDDSHLVVFTGPSRYNDAGIRLLLSRLRLRGFQGVIVLEQWPDTPGLLLEARARLNQLASWATSISSAREAYAPDLAVQIAKMAAEHTSWRRRLEWVRDVLHSPAFDPSPDRLAYLAIFLRFLGTGAVPCEEDGSHHRPSRHAHAARDIEQALLSGQTRASLPLIRSILRWLPSHDAAFRSSEPLTRIRDIAHRSDIGRELKQEIKHTLQNKLHRSAGPEDLETSARLLARITAPGAGYPPDFVEEFQIFHAELEEYFNARSLEEDLRALELGDHPALSAAVRELLEHRHRGDHSSAALDRQLELLMDIRGALQFAFVAMGNAQAQRMRIADIKLEDLAFVLLSERVNQLEAQGAPLPWKSVLANLVVAIRNVSLSGARQVECGAIARALERWGESFDPNDRDGLLALTSSLDRARRLASSFTDDVLALLPPRVEQLGRLLGVPKARIRFFCEAEIRRGVAFQLSRLATLALDHSRRLLGLPPWDAVVTGTAVGTLVEADRLEDLPVGHDPCIVLLHRAEGDEEIDARVAGILLAHDIPHLSHLGVRARQNRVAFATVREATHLKRWSRLSGKRVELRVAAGAVALELAGGPMPQPDAAPPAPRVPAFVLAQDWSVVRLAEADLERCGAKAANCRRLLDAARSPDAQFDVPSGCVLPFGTMELCLARRQELHREYEELLRSGERNHPEQLEERLAQLRHVIDRIEIAEHLLVAILGELEQDSLLVVRSSCNAEDLAGFSGAGLYRSVVGVTAATLPAAIREVWGSIWTRRAVLSRRQAGISDEEVRMAVLVQPAVPAELSFILHTRDPHGSDPEQAYAELAVGLGETLASASAEGTPYRVAFHRNAAQSQWKAFASFDQALSIEVDGGVSRWIVDYTRASLTTDPGARDAAVARLRHVASFVQAVFGAPQDIEGTLAGDSVYVVQTRPQAGVRSPD